MPKDFFDHFLDRQIAHAGFGCELVARVYIGLVVLVMVELERFLRHEGLQRLVIIGQFGKFESHWSTPLGKHLGEKVVREHRSGPPKRQR